jgi:hypothetical protein
VLEIEAMVVREVTSVEYSKIIPEAYHCFNSSNFNKVNCNNSEKVCYLLFKDKKYRLGIIGGIRNNQFYSPFSAPFGGFSFLSSDVSIEYIESAVRLLEYWCAENKINEINITLPPNIYNKKFISKQINVLHRNLYSINSIDLNYHFINKYIQREYIDSIWHSARKSLKRSLKNNLLFYKCSNVREEEDAYKVICKNRSSKGFPLRMTFKDIVKTDISKDFFIVRSCEGVDIAAAIIYYVSKEIVQVVYWGDMPGYAHLRPMNYLSYKVFEYYCNHNITYTDIGPSTENSMPNYGLCKFKESIGCEIELKFTLQKKLI